ncbi:MAG: 4Fe-4S binding protein, partial [Muribaculaceae bacterium]|nr:4Fe-4S binding protein [Muribaculaceae bacterium]
MIFSKFKRRKATRFISADSHKCVACWNCIPACPKHVLGKVSLPFHKHVRIVNADACIGCGRCIGKCPDGVFISLK